MAEHRLLCIEALDGLTTAKRMEAIEDALHSLNFEKRVTGLTDEQKDHLFNDRLTDAAKQRLAACKTDTAKEALIDEYARTRYFRRCAWVDYLNGVTDTPPVGPILGAQPPTEE
jgi:hypothetical protein